MRRYSSSDKFQVLQVNNLVRRVQNDQDEEHYYKCFKFIFVVENTKTLIVKMKKILRRQISQIKSYFSSLLQFQM